ncbi:MAG: hypothetical protein IKU01_04450 [Bacteroidales bacterium]|nr:hypothetical protein [Bacteroidales bacterium]
MSKLEKMIEEPDAQEEETVEIEDPKPEKGKKQRGKANKAISDIMGGSILTKDVFVKNFPFVIYVVALSMLYITNIYVAEDVNREISRLKAQTENLHVEYVYLKSEITSVTKQSNMARMLKDKGIKESVEPLKRIVVEKKGGRDD